MVLNPQKGGLVRGHDKPIHGGLKGPPFHLVAHWSITWQHPFPPRYGIFGLLQVVYRITSGMREAWNVGFGVKNEPLFCPKKWPKPNRKVVFQPPGYVKLRGCSWCKWFIWVKIWKYILTSSRRNTNLWIDHFELLLVDVSCSTNKLIVT